MAGAEPDSESSGDESDEGSWSYHRIRQVVENRFHKRPCRVQLQVAKALYERQNDVVAVAATGAGKTLSFWIPLLMALVSKSRTAVES